MSKSILLIAAALLFAGCLGFQSPTAATPPPTPQVPIGDPLVVIYPCHVISVIDGDTYELVCQTFSLGHYGEDLKRMKVRLSAVDTPEVRGVSAEEKARGYAASSFAVEALKPEDFVIQRGGKKKPFRVRGHFLGQGKYRPLIKLQYLDDSCRCYRDLAAELVAAGHEK